MNRNTYFLTLIVVGVCLLSCKTEKFNNFVFVSYSMNNRSDSLNVHDIGCDGFYRMHFNPKAISDKNFEEMDSNSLSISTGIKWYVVEKKEPFFDFNKFFSSIPEYKKKVISTNPNNNEIYNKVVYLTDIINSSCDQVKFLSVGSDDGFSLWVNGDSIFSHHVGRSLYPNSDIIPIHLKKGSNIFLFKVDQTVGGWSLYYDFITKTDFEQKFFSEIYSDILESYILPDSTTKIKIKDDPRRKLYNQYSYTISWKTAENIPKIINKTNYLANALPDYLPYPRDYRGILLIDLKLKNKEEKTVFHEEVPVFTESLAKEFSKSLTDFSKLNDPTSIARRNAVIYLYKLNKTDNEKREFEVSTRTKASALFDLYLSNKGLDHLDKTITGARIWGYLSKEDSSIQAFRVYSPGNVDDKLSKHKKLPLIFTVRPFNILMYDTLTKIPLKSNFFKSRDFCSHSQMMKWIERTTRNQVIVVASHGKGLKNFVGDASSEVPLILQQMKKNYNIDTTSVSIFAYSTGATIVLQLLNEINIKIANIGFIGGTIKVETELLKSVLANIKRKNPNLKFIIRQGLDDKKEPVADSRRWVKVIKETPFEVDYAEIPYAGHDIGFDRYGDELIEKILNR